MADATEVHIGGHSKEQVAYQLFEKIARAEGKSLAGVTAANYDREWVLSTYSACLYAIENPNLKGSE